MKCLLLFSSGLLASGMSSMSISEILYRNLLPLSSTQPPPPPPHCLSSSRLSVTTTETPLEVVATAILCSSFSLVSTSAGTVFLPAISATVMTSTRVL